MTLRMEDQRCLTDHAPSVRTHVRRRQLDCGIARRNGVCDGRRVRLMDLQLTGRRAVVTGGSRGIGKAIARALAAEGCDVGLVARDAAATEAAAVELADESGRRVVALPADTGADASVEAMAVRALAVLGGVDILVNAAATPNTGAPLREADLEHEVNVKVRGYLRCARAFAPGMVELGWGRIINISGLAAMAAARGVSISDAEAALTAGIAIGRLVTAEEVAAVVTFLASPLSVAITGDAIAAGGGARGPIHY